MRPFIKLFVVFALAAYAALSADDSISLEGRSYTHSCGYFSNVTGDYVVSYSDKNLPWGSKVFLVYGWKGYQAEPSGTKNFDWANRSEVEMTATDKWVWQAGLTKVLHARSSAETLTGLEFALRIEVPGQAATYKNGGTPWGYYLAPAQIKENPCVDSTKPKPPMEEVPFHIVEKWK